MKARSRRQAREAVLRALYEIDIGGVDAETAIEQSIEQADLTPPLRAFAGDAVLTVYHRHEEIDGLIKSVLENYDFERIAAVDRNVLRLATYELTMCPTIPPAVTLDEAVAIAKKYSTAESGRFVNGVLSRVLPLTEKATWTPGPEAHEEEPAALDAETIEEAETVEIREDSPEAEALTRAGLWRVRTDGKA
ncbi:MAG: transcription antitermination factor NusB [Fimbriimonadaceae bacterium]|nr:transcription antitermination factor NusB [Fimbriimonadaceae bacterium]